MYIDLTMMIPFLSLPLSEQTCFQLVLDEPAYQNLSTRSEIRWRTAAEEKVIFRFYPQQ
jgi:hypothetical protein